MTWFIVSFVRLNSHVTCTPCHLALNSNNGLELIKNYDIVVDATDNVATRYLLNDACVLLGKPLVSGSALRFEGQVRDATRASWRITDINLSVKDVFLTIKWLSTVVGVSRYFQLHLGYFCKVDDIFSFTSSWRCTTTPEALATDVCTRHRPRQKLSPTVRTVESLEQVHRFPRQPHEQSRDASDFRISPFFCVAITAESFVQMLSSYFPVPGVIGCLQAVEVVKIATGMSSILYNSHLSFSPFVMHSG